MDARVFTLLIVAAALAGCGAPAPVQTVTLTIELAPDVLVAADTFHAVAHVTNDGPDSVVISAPCSEIADLHLEGPDGARVGANATNCEKRDKPNVLAAGAAASHDQRWPPQFWAAHPEASPGVYTVVATTTWRLADQNEPLWKVDARAEFRWKAAANASRG